MDFGAGTFELSKSSYSLSTLGDITIASPMDTEGSTGVIALL